MWLCAPGTTEMIEIIKEQNLPDLRYVSSVMPAKGKNKAGSYLHLIDKLYTHPSSAYLRLSPHVYTCDSRCSDKVHKILYNRVLGEVLFYLVFNLGFSTELLSPMYFPDWKFPLTQFLNSWSFLSHKNASYSSVGNCGKLKGWHFLGKCEGLKLLSSQLNCIPALNKISSGFLYISGKYSDQLFDKLQVHN